MTVEAAKSIKHRGVIPLAYSLLAGRRVTCSSGGYVFAPNRCVHLPNTNIVHPQIFSPALCPLLPPMQTATNFTNRPVFPLEVLERIITEDVVRKPGPIALLTASRGLRHCALRHLFKTLKIRISDTKAIQKLDAIICVSNGALSGLVDPCLYIRELHITYAVKKKHVPAIEEAPVDHIGENIVNNVAAPIPTFRDCFGQEAVVNVFTKITQNGHPRTLLLQGLNADGSCSWDHLPDKFQFVFLSLMRLPSLKDVDLQHLADLPPELLQNSHLARFSQVHCGPPHSNPASNGVDVRALSDDYPPLKNLVTDHSYSFLGMKNLFRDLKFLKVINSAVHHIPTSWALIKYARNTLQELTIVENSFTNVDLLTPSLSLLPSLQRFNYEAHRVGPGSLCFQILLLLFNTNAPLSNLHTISIQLDHVRTETEDAAIALVQPPLWKALDDHLASPHFAALRAFSVRLKFTLPAQDNDQSWPEDFFELNNGGPGALSIREPTAEEWNFIQTAPTFNNKVLHILQTSFVGVKHSKPFETSYGVEERRYRQIGRV